jgi:hypothetical protein
LSAGLAREARSRGRCSVHIRVNTGPRRSFRHITQVTGCIRIPTVFGWVLADHRPRREPMRKSNITAIRRELIEITKELYAESRLAADPNRSLRLARAADLLIEARGVDLYRLR